MNFRVLDSTLQDFPPIGRSETRILSICTLSLPLVLCCLLAPGPSDATVSFERCYHHPGVEWAFSVQQTSDGGYVIVGSNADIDAFLMRIDSLGNEVYMRTYGGSGNSAGRSVECVSDGGFAMAGVTNSFGAGGGDAYFVRTDSLGNVTIERTYGGTEHDWASSMQSTEDGGYVLAGMRNYDMYIIKIDSIGDTLWTRALGKPDTSELAHRVQQTFDKGYIIAGELAYGDSLERDILLVRTDSVGDVVWTKRYGVPGSQDAAYSIVQSADSGFVFVALSQALVGAWLVKTDNLGDTVWTREHYLDTPYSILRMSDGGYTIGGSGFSGACLHRTTALGDSIWARTYGYGDACFRSVGRTGDGGYIGTGPVYFSGANTYDIYLVKTDENGMVERDGGVVSIESPLVDTVFADSTYPVVATVQNFRPSFLSGYVIATIDGYLDSVGIVRLESDSSLQVTFEPWHVPPGDSVAYMMRVCTAFLEDADTTNDCVQKSIFAYNPVGAEEPGSMSHARPLRFELLQNEPNPFHSRTVISYSLPVAGAVTLKIYNIAGRLVETIVDEEQKAGVHRVEWSPKDKSSGIYFYRLEADEFADMKKILLLR